MKTVQNYVVPIMVCIVLIVSSLYFKNLDLTPESFFGLIYGSFFYLLCQQFFIEKQGVNWILFYGAIGLTYSINYLFGLNLSDVFSIVIVVFYSYQLFRQYRSCASKANADIFKYLLSFNVVVIGSYSILILDSYFNWGMGIPISVLLYVLLLTALLLLIASSFYHTSSDHSIAASSDSSKEKEFEEIVEVLQTHFEKSECYLNCNLSIQQLAEVLNLSRIEISNALNQGLKVNFYQYIAAYRIEYAKKRIIENENYTIEGLSIECGFNSKTSFNKHFKSNVGKTPSSYKCFKNLEHV
ncbi:AraC family transcriptional regulator [Flavobacterium sp. HSC-61S13]|uniref:helix-turn-helix domain-containing protein n=1 Tax=Flavobacterium sp. HSC-61S13 TaxID=2910963 RepID=UPI00209D209D|nr:helix-turn-helix domain-containing protein [Flavobacterium sp. HSC-61S13]MCP1994744.1 AraC-like DNA-binding protein [Flavobacterium sp. HSC-61S13]